MYENMVTLQVMDTIFYEAQRQGRISFYVTTNGEEAINIASAAALSSDDLIFPQVSDILFKLKSGFEPDQAGLIHANLKFEIIYDQCVLTGSSFVATNLNTILQYREPGLLLWRGFTLQEFANQCFGNKADYGKGRQMPIHYGSNKLNYITVASTVA